MKVSEVLQLAVRFAKYMYCCLRGEWSPRRGRRTPRDRAPGMSKPLSSTGARGDPARTSSTPFSITQSSARTRPFLLTVLQLSTAPLCELAGLLSMTNVSCGGHPLDFDAAPCSALLFHSSLSTAAEFLASTLESRRTCTTWWPTLCATRPLVKSSITFRRVATFRTQTSDPTMSCRPAT